MGNKKNQKKNKPGNAVSKIPPSMARDAEELEATDEEIHADVSTPPPVHPHQTGAEGPSSEDGDEEDDVSGESPVEGKQWPGLSLQHCSHIVRCQHHF